MEQKMKTLRSIFAVLFGAFGLTVILCLVMAGRGIAQGRFQFPDSTAATRTIRFSWHPDRTPGIDGKIAVTRWYVFSMERSNQANISEVLTDSSKSYLRSAFTDGARVRVAAGNDAGQSAFSDTCFLIFTRSVIPPITPPSGTSLPFADSTFTQPKWTYGAGGALPFTQFTNLPALYGRGLYADTGWVSTILSLPKGRIKVVVYGCAAYVSSKITASIGTMPQTTFMVRGDRGRTTVYAHEFQFDVSKAGPFDVKVAMTNGCMKRIAVTLMGADTVAPGAPLSVGVEIK
jgi:hypothetical protein